MTNRMTNERGFAVVYGLVILLLATVGGTALLFMTQKDRIDATDYAKIRSTSQAAMAALKACEGQFVTQPDSSLAILKKYLASPSTPTWLLGTPANAATQQKISLGTGADAPKYSARIAGFDKNNQLLIVEGIGYLSNGGKKRVIASYQLGGLELITPQAPLNAIHISAGFGNCDQPLVINGNVFAGGTNLINGNSGLTINGNFKTGTGSVGANQKITITGNAFFRGSTTFQNGAPSVTGNVGFNSSLNLNSVDLKVTGNVFINGDDLGSGLIKVSAGPYTAKYYTAGGFDPAKIIPASPATKQAVSSSINIAGELGMTATDDVAPALVSSDLATYITGKGGTVYTPATAGLNFNTAGWNLASAYSSKAKWNGFLVIKLASGTSVNLNASGGTFNDKAIWIIETSFEAANWYSSGPASNTLLYIKGTAYLNNFGERFPGTLFRGVIFNAGTGTTTYKMKAGTTIEGALIHSSTTRPQFNNTSTTIANTITSNGSVTNEFASIGLVTLPGSGAAVLTLIDLKIRPKMLSCQL